MTVLLSGSLAFDHIMIFPGYFEDHILPDKLHILNVSFLVDSLEKFRGGVSGNIGYSLGLLGQRCKIVAPVGSDFESYRQALDDAGVDTGAIWVIDQELTASAFITTDRADNQITGFYPGAMGRAGEVGLGEYIDGVTMGVVSPTAPEAMERHVRELTESKTPYMFDPGQQIVALSPDALRKGIEGAHILIGNDYEFAMIAEKTDLSQEQLLASCPIVVVTLGEMGSTIHHEGQRIEIPAARPDQVVDPTGAGDGYRAGLLAGLENGLPLDAAGRIGSLAATYVVEVKGTQSHGYTHEEFVRRFAKIFPDYADAVARIFSQR